MPANSRSSPYLQRHNAAHNQRHNQNELILNRTGHSDQDARRDRQRRIQTGIQLSKPRYDVSQNHGNHHYRKDNQEGRIDQGIEKTLPDRENRFLVLNIPRDDLNQVAAPFAGIDRGGVNGWEHALSPQRLRKHCPGVHTVAHVFNVLAQQRVTDASLQQIEAAKDR